MLNIVKFYTGPLFRVFLSFVDDAGPSRPESEAVRCESFRTPVVKCDVSLTFLHAWLYAGPDPASCFAFSEIAREGNGSQLLCCLEGDGAA